jgi:predicted ester cyclase
MRKNLRLVLVFLVVAILVTTAAGATAQAQVKDPEGTIRAIFGALNAGDVKQATANVADDAVLVLLPPAIAAPDPNVIQGKEVIGKWWTMLAADKAGFELSDFRTDGDKVSWKATMTGGYFTDLGLTEPLRAEGVGIVENGQLKSYIWNMSSESMARLAAAEALAANKQAVRGWLAAWEKGDQKAMSELLAKDFVNHSPPLPEAREGFIAAGVENHAQFPTGKYTIQNLIAAGDMVSVYGHFDGAHTGKPFEGIPATGAKASFDFSLLFKMKDGKIAERWATADDVMGLLVPLGFKLMPPQ